MDDKAGFADGCEDEDEVEEGEKGEDDNGRDDENSDIRSPRSPPSISNEEGGGDGDGRFVMGDSGNGAKAAGFNRAGGCNDDEEEEEEDEEDEE